MKKGGSCQQLLEAEDKDGNIYFVRSNCKDEPTSFAARKSFFCTLFLVFVLLTFFAVAYTIFQGFALGDEQRIKEENGAHHFSKGDNKRPWKRPPVTDKAKMARYIVHTSQWGVLTTFSTHVKGYPWGEVVSVTDGLDNNSTGIPLIYISTFDVAAHDIDATPEVSFTFSEAQGDWCTNNKVDPEDPRCGRVHLFGKIVKLTPDEIPSAKKAMFARHPVMADWPEGHHFFFAKINLTRVEVLDFFGPLSQVAIKDYLLAKP